MAKFKIEAKNDFILTQKGEESSDKPFDVVDNQNQNRYLEVVAVGDQVESCKVGDRIIPVGDQFQAFDFVGQQYVVVRDDQVMGVIR